MTRGWEAALLTAALAATDGARAQIAPAPGLLHLLAQSRWAVNGACTTPSAVYRLEHRGTTVAWFNAQNSMDVEEVRSDTPFEAATVTIQSSNPSGGNSPIGTTWRYLIQADGRVTVEKNGRVAFFITRCLA